MSFTIAAGVAQGMRTEMYFVVAIAGYVLPVCPRRRWRGREFAVDNLGLMATLYVVFSVNFTRFVSRWSKTAKSSFLAGHALVGLGLGAVSPGAVEVPDNDQNDVGRGDVGAIRRSVSARGPMWWSHVCISCGRL